jgi:hypothetical protein
MNRLLRRAAASLLIFLAGGAGAQGIAAGKPQFFAQPPTVVRAANAPGIKSQAVPVRFNAAEMRGAKYLEEVQLTLPNGFSHPVVVDLVTDHGGGIVSWVGRLKDRGNHYRVIATTGPTGTFGSIDTPVGSFRIVPSLGHDWLVDMTAEAPHIPAPPLENDGLLAPESALKSSVDLANATSMEAIPGVNTVAKVTPELKVIDMMFVVTRGLANRLGTGLASRLNFLVTRANTSYADSEIGITLRMVNFTVVDYPDNTPDSTALDDITPAGGIHAAFANIEAVRDQFGADMVTLLRDGSSLGGTGVAWVPSTPDAGSMYSTMQGCVTGCESVWIHEVGHNMGSFHDRATDSWQDGGAASQPGNNYGYAFCKSGALTCNPFLTNGSPGACVSGDLSGDQPECSPGSRDPSNFSDIMAYFHASTTRLYKFSNPGVNCLSTMAGNDGIQRPCGAAMPGTASTADAAGTLNDSRVAISALKANTITNLPGALQFSATGYSATEGAGTITFTVSRVGGSSGAVSVSYSVAGNTATAGSDFTATNGTLNWSDGDTGNKTFTVTLANDGVAEGAESLTASLSNTTGAAGVYLGFPTSAVGLILDNFGGTAGGALPAGFTSTDWTVADDQAYDGTTSLRSAQVVATGSCPPCVGPAVNSDLTYTGTIPAGTIAFAYRVSSYQGLGNFEFSVDGTTVLSASGETGWRLFFYTLPTGGSHTLRWRYTNELTARCNVIIPAAEGGAGCADRVWIDSVSLPSNNVALSVTKTGGGTGTVTSVPAGISCGGTCSASFASGTAVTLTAAPAGGSLFLGWTGGGCSGTGTCQVTLNAATTVTANFVVQAGTPTGAANPTTVDFGGQSMQTTSAPVNVTLANVGTGTLTITGVTASTGYAQTHDCTSLTAAASCTATVTFTPTTQGAVAGTLTFTTNGGTVTVTLAGTGERSLVTHYYRAILNRAPDGPGKTFWESEAARLTALGVNINETWFVMAGYFFNSAEYLAANKTNDQFVADLYNTFFNRPPDAGGQGYWVSQIVGGLPREVVLFSFMFSTEFRTFTEGIFGNTAARPEVDMVVDFFRGLLNRLPDTASFNYWLGQLRTAQCAGAGPVYTAVDQISAAFMFNPEYDNRARNNTQFVTDMYYSFLRRGGDVAGVQYWINELNTGARYRNDVRYFGFLNSAEFGARVQAVIAAGCLP